ncbi:MAG: choice-of-anchor D domain-containing protein [Gemmatimonadota bacterium]|nr:MAG: choice-of-anchor D domain-containing protein [Gemmatimonadota bacterium]
MFIQDLSGEVIDPGVGPVATCFVDVAEGGLGKDLLLQLSGASLFDPFSNPVSVRTVDGIFRVTVPDISLSAQTHNYGFVLMGQSQEWEVTVYNDGTGLLTISDVHSDNFEFVVTSPPFPQEIAPLDSLDILIVFSPSLEGPRSASISLFSNDPDEGLLFLSLTGGGTSVDIDLSDLEHDFQAVRIGTTSDWSFTIFNLGIEHITVFNIVSTHSDFEITHPSFPQNVSPAGSLEVILQFAPTSMGKLEGMLTLTCDDPDEGTILLNVEGIGLAPIIQPSVTNYDFGDVEVGASEGWLLTISNDGTADLTIEALTSNNTEFSVAFPAFPQTIPLGGNIEVVVSFAPSDIGERTGILTITSDDPFDPTLNLTLSGEGVPSAILTMGNGSGAPGSVSIQVPLLLTNRRGVAALRCILSYDASKLDVSSVSPTNRTAHMGIFNWTEPLAGKIVLLIEDLTDRVVSPSTGAVANFFFDVDISALPAEEPLMLSNVALYDIDEGDIFTVSDEPGSFTIIAPDIALSDTDYAFGSVLLDATASWTLTIFNEGTIDLTVTGVTTTNTDFMVVAPSFPQTVEAGGDLEVAIRFTPTSLGPITGAITVVSNDSDEGLLSVTLSGTGVTPNIILSAYSHHYSEVILGTSSSWTMKVFNTGTADLSITHVTTDQADFHVASPIFPQSVKPADSLTVSVNFTPSVLGNISGTLTVFNNDPEDGELSVVLIGVGTAPDINVSETSHDFGEIVVGGMSSWMLRISNIGSADLTLQDISSNRADFSIVALSFPQIVPPGGYLDVMISFSPTIEGFISGELVITSNDVDEGSFFIPMQGRGIAPDIHLSATSQNFGSVLLNKSRSWTFSIHNLGVVLLRVNEVISGTSDFHVISPTFPQNILPGDTIEVNLIFQPVMLGELIDTIRIVSNDPDENILNLQVRGTGVAPHIELSAEAYDFGNVVVGRTASWTLTVRNSGSYDLHLNRIYLADSTNFQIHEVLLPITITPSASSNFTLNFKPLNPGIKTDEITIESNDLDNPVVTFSLTGRGSAPPALTVLDRRGALGSSDRLVPLELSNEMAISKIVFTLQYDSGRLITSEIQPTVRTDHMGTFTWREQSPGIIGVTIDDENKIVEPGSGWVVEFLFDVRSDATLGEIPMTLTNVTLYDTNGVILPKNLFHGTFEIVETLEQVTIAIPHRSKPAGDTFQIPVKLLQDITGLNVLAMEFVIVFNPELLTAISVSDEGTLADAWRGTPNAEYLAFTAIEEDRIIGVIAANFSLWGEGTFLNITFEVSEDAQAGEKSPLHFLNSKVNEGDPPAEFIDGWFSVESVPDIDFSFREHDFGSVEIGESQDWQLTIYNVGTEDLVISDIVVTISDFTLSDITVPQTLSPDSHLNTTVVFSPQSQGQITGELRITSNDTDEPTASLSLLGVGTPGVDVQLAYFSGYWTGRDVLLKWTFASYDDVLGFHVYRKGENEIEYSRLTAEPLMYDGKSLFRDMEVPGSGLYSYRLAAVDNEGLEELLGTVAVKVGEIGNLSYFLSQNFPNPFNPKTRIEYTLEKADQISLSIYNVMGQKVRNLVSARQGAGRYTVFWDGTNDSGEAVPSGVYFYILETMHFHETRSMLLLR